LASKSLVLKTIEMNKTDEASASGLVDQPTSVVIDTNVILDMFLYTDPRVSALVAALNSGELQWLATRVMREELARVLQYEHLQKRLVGKTSAEVASTDQGSATARALLILDKMDQQAHLVEVAPRASYVCKDVDDQKFIDLAQAHRSMLISKDKAVLSMKNRMARVGVQVMSVYEKTS
jgi:putative PIN family toxin of toxin-antitoxin system